MKRDQMNPSLERLRLGASEAKQKQSGDPRGCNDHPDSSATPPAHAWRHVFVETLAALDRKKI
ncbi:MAG: hypothetical protein Q8Q12_04690 [bacterium]|nr:hypothetical protein [bacterium]